MLKMSSAKMLCLDFALFVKMLCEVCSLDCAKSCPLGQQLFLAGLVPKANQGKLLIQPYFVQERVNIFE